MTVMMTQLESVEGPNARRRRALGEALLEISTNPGDGRDPAIALRGYGEGCVALALGGVFDPPQQQRLQALSADLDRWASVELAVDLSQVVRCSTVLVRTLTALRMRRLVAGARVELHNPPRELVVDLGHVPVTAFSLSEADAPPSSWTAPRPARQQDAATRTGGAR